MAIDPKKLQEVQDVLKEIEKIYKTIGQTNPLGGFKLNTIKDIDQTLQNVNDELDKAQIKLTNWEDSVSGIYDSFKSIVSEISKSSTGINASKKALTASSKVAAELRDYHLGISKLSIKEIQNQKQKFLTSQQNLKSAQNILQEEEARLINGKTIFDLSNKERNQLLEIRKALKANNRALQDKDKLYAQTLADLEAAEETETKINKQLGLTGGLLKGISKIPILGDVFDANEAVEEMDKHLRAGGSSAGALGAGIKNIGKQLKDGVLNSSNLIVAAFTFMVSALRDIDKGAGQYAKSMNASYSESLKVREEMADIATASGDAALSANRLLQTQMAVGNALGTNAKLNKADAKTMTKLVQQAGFQYDELMNIQKLSLINGKTLEDNTKEILGGAEAYATRNGIVVNEKEVLKEVNNASKALQLSLGQSTQALAESVVKAKQLGIDLKIAEQIASSMLNFESSIEAELEAELLTGKNLNLERARQLALEGKVADAAAEVASQLGNAEEFGKMNVIQQEALAKSIGMTRESLAASLIEREALAAIGAKDAEEARKKYDTLRLTMSAEEAAAALGDEQLARQYEQQNNAERFAQAVEKIKDIFTSIVDGPLGVLLSGLAEILNSSVAIYGITGAIAGLYAGKMIQGVMMLMKAKRAEKALSFGQAMIDIVKGAWSSLGGLPVVGPVLAGAAIAAGYALLSSRSNEKGDDIMSSPGYGKRTLFGPEGAIQLNDKDTVIAGTNLFGNDVKSEPDKPTEMAGAGEMKAGGTSTDMTQTNALLNQIATLLSQPSVLTLDNNAFGEATKTQTSKVE